MLDELHVGDGGPSHSQSGVSESLFRSKTVPTTIAAGEEGAMFPS